MDKEKKSYLLTDQQYNLLYCRAFARLDDIARQAARAMEELEELQLTLAEEAPAGTEARTQGDATP